MLQATSVVEIAMACQSDSECREILGEFDKQQAEHPEETSKGGTSVLDWVEIHNCEACPHTVSK